MNLSNEILNKIVTENCRVNIDTLGCYEHSEFLHRPSIDSCIEQVRKAITSYCRTIFIGIEDAAMRNANQCVVKISYKDYDIKKYHSIEDELRKLFQKILKIEISESVVCQEFRNWVENQHKKHLATAPKSEAEWKKYVRNPSAWAFNYEDIKLPHESAELKVQWNGQHIQVIKEFLKGDPVSGEKVDKSAPKHNDEGAPKQSDKEAHNNATFSHIGSHLPKFSKYLNGADASICVKKMLKEKKGGKVLVKFFSKAIEHEKLKNDPALKKLFDKAVSKVKKLSKKESEKFKKVEKAFSVKAEKVDAKQASPAAQAPEPQTQQATAPTNPSSQAGEDLRSRVRREIAELLSNDPQVYEKYKAQELPRYQLHLIRANIANRYAGMGAGGLSSSGYLNELKSAEAAVESQIRASFARLQQQARAQASQYGL